LNGKIIMRMAFFLTDPNQKNDADERDDVQIGLNELNRE